MSTPQSTSQDPGRQRAGVAYAAAAYGSWGVLPLYFKAVQAVPSVEVLAHRIVWSLVFLLGLTAVRRQWDRLALLLRSPRTQAVLVATTGLIAVNWLLFIWSIANGRLVEASLGYFINPLFSVLLGVVFLRERLRRWQTVAVGLALVAIVLMTLRLGRPPLIALALAFCFGVYGLLRKQVPASGIQGLTVETMMLAPVAVGWAIWRWRAGELVFLHESRGLDLLLMSAGALTALPLIWFAEGARRLRLATLGFMQYLAPTGQLLLAVLAFGEPFTRDHLFSFGLIWVALGLYSFDTWRGTRRRPAPQG